MTASLSPAVEEPETIPAPADKDRARRRQRARLRAKSAEQMSIEPAFLTYAQRKQARNSPPATPPPSPPPTLESAPELTALQPGDEPSIFDSERSWFDALQRATRRADGSYRIIAARMWTRHVLRARWTPVVGPIPVLDGFTFRATRAIRGRPKFEVVLSLGEVPSAQLMTLATQVLPRVAQALLPRPDERLMHPHCCAWGSARLELTPSERGLLVVLRPAASLDGHRVYSPTAWLASCDPLRRESLAVGLHTMAAMLMHVVEHDRQQFEPERAIALDHADTVLKAGRGLAWSTPEVPTFHLPPDLDLPTEPSDDTFDFTPATLLPLSFAPVPSTFGTLIPLAYDANGPAADSLWNSPLHWLPPQEPYTEPMPDFYPDTSIACASMEPWQWPQPFAAALM